MTDAEAEQQKDRVKAISDRWLKTLGLGWWKVTFGWYRGAIPNHDGALGVCSTDWKYQHADISFDLTRVADQDDEELEKIVLHEFAHIFLNMIRPIDGVTDEEMAREEFICNRLALSWLWTRDHFQEKELAHAE